MNNYYAEYEPEYSRSLIPMQYFYSPGSPRRGEGEFDGKHQPRFSIRALDRPLLAVHPDDLFNRRFRRVSTATIVRAASPAPESTARRASPSAPGFDGQPSETARRFADSTLAPSTATWRFDHDAQFAIV
jgi:hypothetical protein